MPFKMLYSHHDLHFTVTFIFGLFAGPNITSIKGFPHFYFYHVIASIKESYWFLCIILDATNLLKFAF